MNIDDEIAQLKASRVLLEERAVNYRQRAEAARHQGLHYESLSFEGMANEANSDIAVIDGALSHLSK